jgi:RHS repeat-associated protein
VTPDRLGSIGKYFPYGQERPSATTDGKEKFATYFRDSETGLDYADQRYHQPGMGRFMTPDPYSGSASAKDPGSWNRYSYTGGDPVNRSDPGGLDYGFDGQGFYSNLGDGTSGCLDTAFVCGFWNGVSQGGVSGYGGIDVNPSVFAYDLGQVTSDTFLTFSSITPYGGILGSGDFGNDFLDPVEQLRQEWEDCKNNFVNSVHAPFQKGFDYLEANGAQLIAKGATIGAVVGAFVFPETAAGEFAAGLAAPVRAYIAAHYFAVVSAVTLDPLKLLLALAANVPIPDFAVEQRCGNRP